MIDKQPETTLAEMAEYLGDHETHSRFNEQTRFAWTIKVHSFDSTGKNNPDYPVQHRWDQRWDTFVQEDHELFGYCCEDGLSHFFDEHEETGHHYFAGVGDDHPLFGMKSCQFFTRGRSGGYLILEALDGHVVDPELDWVEQIEEDPTWLTMVYAACKDVDGFKPQEALEYNHGYRRHHKEEEWDEEAERSEQEKKDLKLIGMFIYLRAHPVRHRAIIEAAKRLSLPTTPDGEPNYDT